jgi:hypothetical protein
MKGLAAPRPRGAPPAFGSGASRPSSTSPGSTHGSALALGCACRPGFRTRAPARGGRRVVPVAGHDAAAAGVSRRDGSRVSPTCTSHGSKPGSQIKPCASTPARPARSPGNQGAPSGGTATSPLLHKRHGAMAKPTFCPRTATACSRRARPPAWGSRGASPLLCPTSSPVRVRVALRTAMAALRDTTGPRAPSVAARQCCGAKAGIQAVSSQRRASTHVCHHRKNPRGRREVEGRGAHGGAAM